MTTECQMTPEEEAYGRILEEKEEMLSEVACNILAEAESVAYAEYMVRNYCFQPEEYDEAMEKMRLAAAKLTDWDRELLAELVRAAKAAAASIDPDDATPAGRGVYLGYFHHYYKMVSDMVEYTLQGRPQSGS